MTSHIRRATSDDLNALAALFDGYRVFYAQPSDPAAARAFLAARLQHAQSVICIAERDDGSATGFTQLYPMFSSLRMARVWILNDLYVAADARRGGVAAALLRAATDYARSDGALRLELETAPDNAAAQALYRALGWQPCDDARRFQLTLHS
ncbi:MAG: GNAT family N-acetyltransferase [Luteimonas sp.]